MATRNYFNDFIGKRTVDGYEIVNLTKSIDVSGLLTDVHTFRYNIKDGDNPDSLSKNYYNDSAYWWVIMLVNRMIDPFYDWPLNFLTLQAWYQELVSIGEITDSAEKWQEFKTTNDGKRSILILKEKYLDNLLNIILENIDGTV